MNYEVLGVYNYYRTCDPATGGQVWSDPIGLWGGNDLDLRYRY
jgi:hypothetical protein